MVSAIACVGCKKDEPSSGDGAAGPGKRERGAPARVEAIALEELGEQPGLLADGVVFAAVRAGTAQDFLRQIPLPSDITRELADARRELGFDPLTDDVLARFAVPPDAVVSMTLGRPVGVEARKAVAKGIHRRDERFLGLVARVMNGTVEELPFPKPPMPGSLPVDPLLVPKVVDPAPLPEAPPPPAKPIVFSPPAAVAVPPPIAPPPAEEPPPRMSPDIVPPEPAAPPYEPPPLISPAERSEIDELLRRADAMATQFRFHIPSDDPDKIFGELRTRVEPRMLTEGDALCQGLEVEVCVAGGRGLLIARRDGKAAVLDMVMFTSRYFGEADMPARRGAVAEVVEARRSELPALAKMAGHASAYVDAQALVELVDHALVGKALLDLSWTSSYVEGVSRSIGEGEQLRRLLEAPRLFDGLLANAHHERGRTQLQITWPLREDQEALARGTLAPPPLVVPVPSLAALCDGALFCARSRGLPSPQELGTKLGLGLYGSAERLEDALDTTDEAGAALLLVSTWPNALGTLLWHLPIAEARGAEAALARGLLDAVARVGGAGLGVRRIDVGRGSLVAEYAAYARVPVNDLSLVGTLLTMAQLRLTPTTVEGVDGNVSMLRIPEDDVPAVLMTREDPDTVKNAEGKEVRYGWLSVVDGPDRLAWLLGLPTDDGQEPLLYAEIPDLWRLVASVPEAVEELGFARTWATDRHFKVALHLDDGQPHLLMEIAMRPADAEPAKAP
jgi:hypothetical protein